MVDPTEESPEEFAPTPEHEYQDSHYHDEDPEIVNDEAFQRSANAALAGSKNRRPPPRRHYEEE